MGYKKGTEVEISNITCIQLRGVYPDFCYRVIMPDYGMPYIGTLLSKEGFNVKVYMEHVKAPVWDDLVGSDLVCFSTMSAAAQKTYDLADRVRRELGVPVIIGGTHATYFPESTLEHCDYVVMAEGDETIIELVEAIRSGGDISGILGLAYKKGDEVIINKKRPIPENFDTVPDFKLIQGYEKATIWNILRKGKISIIPIQASRGCPFSCSYCIVDTMFSKGGYRFRSIESIIEDLKDKRQYAGELIFVDNNFAAIPKYTKELLRRMIEEKIRFRTTVLVRLDVVKDEEMMQLMRDAGITQLYVGIESMNPETLEKYEKKQAAEKTTKAIEIIHKFGFEVSASFVVGADSDSVRSLRDTVKYLIDNKVSVAYFFPLWGHYPEEKASDVSMIPWYRSIYRGWEYYDGNFVSFFPMQMPPSVLQKEIIKAHRSMFSWGSIVGAFFRGRLSIALDKLAHKYMWSLIEKPLKGHIKWLQNLEKDFYDEDGVLKEDELYNRVQSDPKWPIFPECLRKLDPEKMPEGRREVFDLKCSA